MIDEDRFIERVLAQLRYSGEVVIPPGDDCAAIRRPDGTLLLLAVDQVSADVHYHGRHSANPTDPRLAGRKLLARNLSDIAAMGGEATFALICLAAAADCPEDWLWAFMEGIRELAVETGVQIVGGDLGRAGAEVGSLTIVGEVSAERVLRRTGAKAGDQVLVTGTFGGSLREERHLHVMPRLAPGKWLAAHATSAIDVSDGLLKDLSRLAKASEVVVELDLQAVPRTDGASLEEALLDGEDYELIVTVPVGQVSEVLRAWPFAELPLTVVGRCLEEESSRPLVHDPEGNDLLAKLAQGGWRHFAV